MKVSVDMLISLRKSYFCSYILCTLFVVFIVDIVDFRRGIARRLTRIRSPTLYPAELRAHRLPLPGILSSGRTLFSPLASRLISGLLSPSPKRVSLNPPSIIYDTSASTPWNPLKCLDGKSRLSTPSSIRPSSATMVIFLFTYLSHR